MKKRELKSELRNALARIEEYEDAWSQIWVAVGTEPGDYEAPQWARSSGTPTAEITTVVARRMHSLRSARSAARLWKRAAKRYRLRFVAERAAWRHMREQLWAREAELTQAREDWEHVREERDAARQELEDNRATYSNMLADLLTMHGERDAARAELASMRKDRDALNEDCAALKAERDDAIRAADSRHAKLVEVADKLRASRVDVDILQKAMARMHPVVEAAVQAYDAAQASSGTVLQEVARIGTLQRLDIAVEAYRAGAPDPAGLCGELGPTSVSPDLPDIQRNYRPPDNDTAERIAADAASESSRPATWVVRRRIEALVDSGIRGAMLRIAIACDIHEACGHVVDDIVEAIERLKRDRSLLAATTGEARKLEADAFAYRKHFRAVASLVGASIMPHEWEEMTTATAERVAADVESYADRADARIHAALEAAAERAVEWWNGTNSSTASLRRAVMGGEGEG